MTYHDPELPASVTRGHEGRIRRGMRCFAQGAMHLNLFQATRQIRLGSVEEDWRAVGNAMREAFVTVAGKRD